MLPMLEGIMSGGQYAYQQGRSTELLLGDLDAFVENSIAEGRHTYVVGLDIQGAFDCASIVHLMDTPEEYGGTLGTPGARTCETILGCVLVAK